MSSRSCHIESSLPVCAFKKNIPKYGNKEIKRDKRSSRARVVKTACRPASVIKRSPFQHSLQALDHTAGSTNLRAPEHSQMFPVYLTHAMTATCNQQPQAGTPGKLPARAPPSEHALSGHSFYPTNADLSYSTNLGEVHQRPIQLQSAARGSRIWPGLFQGTMEPVRATSTELANFLPVGSTLGCGVWTLFITGCFLQAQTPSCSY